MESIPNNWGINFDEADELAKSIAKNQITKTAPLAGTSNKSQYSIIEDDFEVLDIVQKPAIECKHGYFCSDHFSQRQRIKNQIKQVINRVVVNIKPSRPKLSLLKMLRKE